MKTVTVISDTHGNMRGLSAISQVLRESDFVIHLGDTSGDGAKVKSEYNENTILINGNCDPIKCGEDETVIEIEGVKIFATHGHLYSAKSTLNKLYMRGKELGCQVVLYGHTHRAAEEELDGVTLINPGTMSRYSQNSYCYLVVNGDKFTAKTVVI